MSQQNFTSEVTYQTELRTSCIHLASGNEVITDAPKDNHGRGEAFSPTDLVATSLAACMMSIMGIKARQMQLDEKLKGAKAFVKKGMASDPRRIEAIYIEMKFPKNDFTEKEKSIFEHAALTCPVFLSLHPDMKKEVVFYWE